MVDIVFAAALIAQRCPPNAQEGDVRCLLGGVCPNSSRTEIGKVVLRITRAHDLRPPDKAASKIANIFRVTGWSRRSPERSYRGSGTSKMAFKKHRQSTVALDSTFECGCSKENFNRVATFNEKTAM